MKNLPTLAKSEGDYLIQLDEDTKTLVVDAIRAKSRITIDLVAGQISIESPGDIDIHAGGKLSLRGDGGIDVLSGADLRLSAGEETIVRGKMVRIN